MENDQSRIQPADVFDLRLAQRLAQLRTERGWSLDELAQSTGISRATLSRLERGETSPTANLMGKLCTAYGMTMSRMLGTLERHAAKHIPRAAQQIWVDPETGFERRLVSPPSREFRMEMIEGMLPAGAVIDYEAAPVRGMEQHIWVLEGVLNYTLDGIEYRLYPGDCLRFHLFGATRFFCPGPQAARYLVIVCEP
ncbi:MAG TPA: XRE family transcriptional regulator [Burkholderiaceae bacterium]|jgi:transcriptional regulator with XRE-family HTH domain